MTINTKSYSSKVVAKPNRRARLIGSLACIAFILVIIFLPLDEWILDKRGVIYAQMMSQMTKTFICITAFIIGMGFFIGGGRGGDPNRRNPGTTNSGMGHWRGPL